MDDMNQLVQVLWLDDDDPLALGDGDVGEAEHVSQVTRPVDLKLSSNRFSQSECFDSLGWILSLPIEYHKIRPTSILL